MTMTATMREKLGLFLSVAIVLLPAMSAEAALITFTSRTIFDAAAPGLPVETFESGIVAPGGVTVCSGPLSSSAASSCFAAGALMPGVTYSSTSGSMVVLGAGFPTVGNASKVLGPNLFLDSFDLTFADASAVGFDALVGPVTGNVQISVFSPTNQLLGSSLIAVPRGGTFFGVISTGDLIGRNDIAGQTPALGELVDNLAFGTPAAVVPEPSTFALVALGVALTLRIRPRLPAPPPGVRARPATGVGARARR